MIDLCARTVDLDDQQRVDVEGVAGVDELLSCVNRRAIHHLHAGGNDASADDLAHALPGILGRGKADEYRARAIRLLEDANDDLGNDAEQTLRTGDDAEKIKAARLERLAAHEHG